MLFDLFKETDMIDQNREVQIDLTNTKIIIIDNQE